MTYFIFLNNFDDKEWAIYKIAENESDFNNLNIDKNSYKIINDSVDNFNNVKYGIQWPVKYNNNKIIYEELSYAFSKIELEKYIENFKKNIQGFINNNYNHPLLNKWINYSNQLNSLNLDTIDYLLNKSLEQYFYDLGQPSLHPLQLP